MKKISFLFVLFSALAVWAEPDVGPGARRYATDAYPGFDSEKDIISPARKEPKWFSFWNGPKCDNPRGQLAYCADLENASDWAKAAEQYDALVREWPTAPEAPRAQERFAALLADRLDECEEALKEYRYLLDFYSISCDYNAIADRMYELAGRMRLEGKTIVFFRFRNTVDVRRAYESCVLHAPGATWAAQALLTIGELREEEEKHSEAVRVYENLRNQHYGAPEVKTAVAREAAVRMKLLRDHVYNRERCLDTINFLNLAETLCAADDVAAIRAYRDEARARMENEAYLATRFYDTRMRTKRSAVAACEQFLKDYPDGAHAEEIRSRLEVLKGQPKP